MPAARRTARVLGGLVVAVTVLLAAACSSQDSGTADAPESRTATTATTPASTVRHLDPAAFATAITQPGVVLLDVRTASEYGAGRLANATNIDMQASDFMTRVGKLDKSASYALYCRSGHRSGIAAEQMTAAGFTKVVDLAGGIAAWTAAGKPVVTS